jgi:hypothetical protein
MQTDWRTDNWAGHRDVGRDPANYHYQRYQGEFYPYQRHQYEADIEAGPNLIGLILFALALLLIVFNLPVLKECLTNINEHTTIMFDLLRNVQIYGN